MESKVYREENRLRRRERPSPIDLEHLDSAVPEAWQALTFSDTEIRNPVSGLSQLELSL